VVLLFLSLLFSLQRSDRSNSFGRLSWLLVVRGDFVVFTEEQTA